MVSLALLTIVTVALFTILNTSFMSMNDSAVNIRRTQHVEACIELLRGSFRKLPQSSSLKSLSSEEAAQIHSLFGGGSLDLLRDGNTHGPPLLIAGVAQFFSWQVAQGAMLNPKAARESRRAVQQQQSVPEAEKSEASHFLVASPQADGTITLFACSPSWAKPLPLLDKLSDIRWRFLPVNTTEWKDTWRAPNRPAQIELSLTLSEKPEEPLRLHFWIAVQGGSASPVR